MNTHSLIVCAIVDRKFVLQPGKIAVDAKTLAVAVAMLFTVTLVVSERRVRSALCTAVQRMIDVMVRPVLLCV